MVDRMLVGYLASRAASGLRAPWVAAEAMLHDGISNAGLIMLEVQRSRSLRQHAGERLTRVWRPHL